MDLKIGDKAPDFTLPSTIGDAWTLSKNMGKENIVVSFFPFAFSPVCTKEMCGFRDILQVLGALKAQVVGVSVDSPFTLKEFSDKLGLKFPLLSDFNKEVCRNYGAMHETLKIFKGVAKRSIFIIDKQGVVRYVWVSDDPGKEPSFGAIRKTLEELKN